MCLRRCHFLFLIIILSYDLGGQDSLRTLTTVTDEIEKLESGISLLETSISTLISDDPLVEYDLLKALIENKEELNSRLNEQNDLLSNELEKNRLEIIIIEQKTTSKRKQYQAVLKAMYRKKLIQNQWIYLLSAQSVEDAMIRFRHYRQLEKHVRKEKTLLSELAITKEKTIAAINEKLLEANHNLNKLERSIIELKDVEEKKLKAIKKIKADEEKAKRRLRQKNKKKEASANNISKNKKNEYSLNEGSNLPNIDANLPENQNFRSKRGKLEWPVDNGVIVEKFGRRPHDVVPNVWIENNGIGIMTKHGQKVKAVSKGIVNEILKINEEGYMIIIAHGQYYTSYFTIASAFVKKGDHLNEGQIIGTISKSSSLSPILNFEVWRGFEKENPSYWLKR